jgi:hypothetical protein
MIVAVGVRNPRVCFGRREDPTFFDAMRGDNLSPTERRSKASWSFQEWPASA